MLCERPDKLILALLESDDELKLQAAKCRAVLDEETNPLTRAQLAAAPTGQQKRMIGERLYVKIAKPWDRQPDLGYGHYTPTAQRRPNEPAARRILGNMRRRHTASKG